MSRFNKSRFSLSENQLPIAGKNITPRFHPVYFLPATASPLIPMYQYSALTPQFPQLHCIQNRTEVLDNTQTRPLLEGDRPFMPERKTEWQNIVHNYRPDDRQSKGNINISKQSEHEKHPKKRLHSDDCNENIEHSYVTGRTDSRYLKPNKLGCVTATKELIQLHQEFLEHTLSLRNTTGETFSNDVAHGMILSNEIQSTGCDCPEQHRDQGIHHNIYKGKMDFKKCDPYSNNENCLFHYRLSISPLKNFETKKPTAIEYNGRKFLFEGYSLFSHQNIDDISAYTFFQNNINYTVNFVKEDCFPECFCIKDLDLFGDFLFNDIMELYDWKYKDSGNGCQSFHFMPRFVHKTCSQDVGFDVERCEMLAIPEVFNYLIKSCETFIPFSSATSREWYNLAENACGSIVIHPKKKPQALRVDWVIPSKLVNRLHCTPHIEHTVSLMKGSTKLNKQDFKWTGIKFSSEGYLKTGLQWDVCQHASYLPSVWNYLLFMQSLPELEQKIGYTFKNKSLLKIALTQPSYLAQTSFSSNVCNSLKNLGKPRPDTERGLLPLSLGFKVKGAERITNVMASLFDEEEKTSECLHNERLEFLGDAVLDYLCSIHLFSMFPQYSPGNLSIYRSSLVQKENLKKIADDFHVGDYILIQHKWTVLEHLESYLGNTVEAILGAVYLDSNLNAVDDLLANFLFHDDKELLGVWKTFRRHPLQMDHNNGDRHLIPDSRDLKKFLSLETKIGVEFKYIRLLAKAFTHSVNGLDDQDLTRGSYECLEFLGDAILKFVCSDYLYKHFPGHQEGHLTLLRMSLIKAKCLAKASRELQLDDYIIYHPEHDKELVNEKVISDVFEALLGALHIDRDLRPCRKVIEVCILSRLTEYIINQDWLDAKSQLQQCCNSLRHSLRTTPGNAHHPIYKKLKQGTAGPVSYFEVAVYFNERQLGIGTGRSCKEAEQNAAKDALGKNFFELQQKQKRIVEQKFSTSRYSAEDEKHSLKRKTVVENTEPKFARQNNSSNTVRNNDAAHLHP